VASYLDGDLIDLVSVPMGHVSIVSGLAAAFNVSESIAQRIDLEEMFRTAAGQPIVERARGVLRARQRAVFSAIRQQLESRGRSWRPEAGAVVTGVGASLPEVVGSAREALQMPVRLGIPSFPRQGYGNDLDVDSAAAVGIVALQARTFAAIARAGTVGAGSGLDDLAPQSATGRWTGVRPALTRWLRDFIPTDESG
jgi:cell division ATPase FtsA